ncbi:MAG TPA: DUF4133 domain-containing protein [Puia sp.]|jgi:hypothetical protein|nr:DUF4133 domain-containing protein [Puia sp.]
MTTRVYPIHRAIGRPVVCKGLKGPYIIVAGISLIADLLLFVILYLTGTAPWLCIALAFALGGMALATISKLSHRYGAVGLQQRMAVKRLSIHISSRQAFIHLKTIKNYVHEQERVTARDGILRAYPH